MVWPCSRRPSSPTAKPRQQLPTGAPQPSHCTQPWLLPLTCSVTTHYPLVLPTPPFLTGPPLCSGRRWGLVGAVPLRVLPLPLLHRRHPASPHGCHRPGVFFLRGGWCALGSLQPGAAVLVCRVMVEWCFWGMAPNELTHASGGTWDRPTLLCVPTPRSHSQHPPLADIVMNGVTCSSPDRCFPVSVALPPVNPKHSPR
jgi:hypothetical protein